MSKVATADVTVAAIDEMEGIHGNLARRNGQPALAAFVQESPAEPFRAYGIMVFAVDGDRIAGITGFAGYPELFPLFELPAELSSGAA